VGVSAAGDPSRSACVAMRFDGSAIGAGPLLDADELPEGGARVEDGAKVPAAVPAVPAAADSTQHMARSTWHDAA